MELDCLIFCGFVDCRLHFQERVRNPGMKLFSLRRKRLGLVSAALVVVALMLLFPVRSEAYAGPGAGCAVLSSFWTIFVAFLYSFYALVTWPIRQLLRMFRRRKAYGKAQVKRVVIVGFDGMDPVLASRFMDEGKLPHLSNSATVERFVRSERHSPPSLPSPGPRFKPELILASIIFMIS